jgi:hypothetical protein
MSEAANVKSVDAIREFRAAVIEFAQTASTSLGESQSDVQRTIWWLQQDRLAHWQRELKNRNKKLAEARSALEQKEIQKVSTVLEKRQVALWQTRVAEAEDKLVKIKRWVRELERELIRFKAQCQRLGRTLDGEVPQVIARIDRMLGSLEAYVHLRPKEERRTARSTRSALSDEAKETPAGGAGENAMGEAAT